jgi:hypothetical protein
MRRSAFNVLYLLYKYCKVHGDAMKVLRILLLVMLFSTVVEAENYEISVTRKGSNIYKVEGKNIYIHTRYCYEYVYSENAFLKVNGYSGEIIFLDSGGNCNVKAVYASSEQKPGKYAVTINREDDDWYEIWGTGIHIKTSGCLSLALGQEAVLSITDSGYGTLFIEGNQCIVEGLYSKISL